MAERKKSMIDVIKQKIEQSGSSLREIFFLKAGNKRRVRFLSDVEDAVSVVWHDNYKEGINTPCLKYYGMNCEYCDQSNIRTRDQFVWTVFDYEDDETKVFMFKAHDSTPVPALVAMYEAYGTLLDRDYVISRKGDGIDTSYNVVPLDKEPFKKKKYKAYTETELFEKLRDAYSVEAGDYDADEDDDEDDYEFEEEDFEDEDDGEDVESDLDDIFEEDDEEEEVEEKPKPRRRKAKKGTSTRKKKKRG